MKRMKKIFVFFTMLLSGLSFKGANNVEKNVVADAAEVGSYAYLNSGWKYSIKSKLSAQGVTSVNLIKSILITNDESKVPMSGYLEGCPVEVGYKDTNYTKPEYYTNGCAVAAYVYPNATDATMFDCVFYANVETIYPTNGQYLFSNSLPALEKITFDCKFSMANASDNSMYRMFGDNYNLTAIEGLENFDTTNVTNMEYVFVHCHSLTTLNLSGFDTSKVTAMRSMFSSCEKITTITGFENWDTSNVTNMNMMFANCYELKELDVSHFDTSQVIDMSYMFQCCYKLTTLDGLNGENWDTSKVTNMSSMFYACSSLTTLDLSNFDLSSISDKNKLSNMLGSNSNLKELKTPKNINGYTIQLPSKFGMTEIDPSMEGWTLLQGSKEFNALYNTLMKINVCTEYAQAPELQAMYDGLVNEEKEKLATLTDDGGVILTDKLSYMVSYADYKANEATMTSGSHLVLSAKTGQYLVIVIACLSLTLIGGYYLLQKRKYAK